jgi:hypothetical protein
MKQGVYTIEWTPGMNPMSVTLIDLVRAVKSKDYGYSPSVIIQNHQYWRWCIDRMLKARKKK